MKNKFSWVCYFQTYLYYFSLLLFIITFIIKDGLFILLIIIYFYCYYLFITFSQFFSVLQDEPNFTETTPYTKHRILNQFTGFSRNSKKSGMDPI